MSWRKYALCIVTTALLLFDKSDGKKASGGKKTVVQPSGVLGGLPLHNADSLGEGQVINHLLRTYQRRARPVRNPNDTVHINMLLALNQVIALDEINQILITKLWFHLVWKDEFLRWNKSEFEGIESVSLDATDIWNPDIMSFNSLDSDRPGYIFDDRVKPSIKWDGSVFWVPSTVMQSSCLIDVSDYPFDKQSCLLKFGTWTNNIEKVNITLLQDYMDQSFTDFLHGEWQVEDCPCVSYVNSYVVDDWPVVECHVNMIRKPLFYVFNLGVPIVLLLVIGSLAFFLPPDSGDKISLSVTVFLALTVFIMVVMENLPSTSQAVPLLEKFIAACTVLLAASTATSVIVVSIAGRPEQSTPPRWVRRVILGKMAACFCVKVKKNSPQIHDAELTKANNKIANNQEKSEDSALVTQPNTAHDKSEAETWLTVALVMDRLFCALYFICIFGIFMFLAIHISIKLKHSQDNQN